LYNHSHSCKYGRYRAKFGRRYLNVLVPKQ
jgi:hypothetical protein